MWHGFTSHRLTSNSEHVPGDVGLNYYNVVFQVFARSSKRTLRKTELIFFYHIDKRIFKTNLLEWSWKLPPSSSRTLANSTAETKGTSVSSSRQHCTSNLYRFFFVMNAMTPPTSGPDAGLTGRNRIQPDRSDTNRFEPVRGG